MPRLQAQEALHYFMAVTELQGQKIQLLSSLLFVPKQSGDETFSKEMALRRGGTATLLVEKRKWNRVSYILDNCLRYKVQLQKGGNLDGSFCATKQWKKNDPTFIIWKKLIKHLSSGQFPSQWSFQESLIQDACSYAQNLLEGRREHTIYTELRDFS